MKKAGALLGTILDLGEELLRSGAEVWRVEETLRELFEAYCFKRADLWVISTSIQATVHTWDDRAYTQIRGVSGRHYDLDMQERLYALVNEVCETPTGIDTIRRKLDEVIARPGITNRARYLASAVGSLGFMVLLGGGVREALVVVINAAVLTYMSIHIGSSLGNKLAYNTIAAIVMETITLTAIAAGLISDPAVVTISAIYLLISSMALVSGVGELMHDNTLAGLSESTSALNGTAGIAIGISIAILFFRAGINGRLQVSSLGAVSDSAISIISCTVGCLGFAMLMGARRKALLFSAAGAAATHCISMLVSSGTGGNYFYATMQGACFVALYAIAVSRLTGIPEAVFRVSCVIPLLPGSNLYYTVMGIFLKDSELFRTQGIKMLMIATGIALGYIAVDVIAKSIRAFSIKATGR